LFEGLLLPIDYKNHEIIICALPAIAIAVVVADANMADAVLWMVMLHLILGGIH